MTAARLGLRYALLGVAIAAPVVFLAGSGPLPTSTAAADPVPAAPERPDRGPVRAVESMFPPAVPIPAPIRPDAAIGRAAAERTGLDATRVARVRGGPTVMTFAGSAPEAGVWADLALLRPDGEGPAGVGTHGDDGRHLLVDCRATGARRATLYIGPFEAPPAAASVRSLVLDGSELPVFEQTFDAVAVEGGYLMMTFPSLYADLLRAGADVEFQVEGGVTARFGLSGSNVALTAQGACGEGGDLGAYAGDPALALSGGWRIEEEVLDLVPEPVLTLPARPPVAPRLFLSCARELVIAGPLAGEGPYDATLAVESEGGARTTADFRIALASADWRSDPLPLATLAAIGRGDIATLTARPATGPATAISFTLAGCGQGETRLDCAAAPPPDVTVSSSNWVPDLGPDQEPGYTAVQLISETAPPLYVDCAGLPFFERGTLPIPQRIQGGYRLRVTVDGPRGVTATGAFRPRGIYAYPGDRVARMGDAILAGGDTLTVTAPARDGFRITYPLSGLRDAIADLDC